MHSFEPRPIRFLSVHAHAGWRIKLYSIVFGEADLDPAAFAPALELALSGLPRPAVTPVRPGVGFGILHRGRGADYLVLGWWDRENELPVRVFVRPAEERSWRPARESESFCVWDLEVIGFERDAYVATLLASPPADADDYLSRTPAPALEIRP